MRDALINGFGHSKECCMLMGKQVSSLISLLLKIVANYLIYNLEISIHSIQLITRRKAFVNTYINLQCGCNRSIKTSVVIMADETHSQQS
jgi:hypothetical protein